MDVLNIGPFYIYFPKMNRLKCLLPIILASFLVTSGYLFYYKKYYSNSVEISDNKWMQQRSESLIHEARSNESKQINKNKGFKLKNYMKQKKTIIRGSSNIKHHEFKIMKKKTLSQHMNVMDCNIHRPLKSKLFNTHWHSIKKGPSQILILTAHLDTRDTKRHSIRIFGVVNRPSITDKLQVYCYIWYSKLKSPVITKTTQISFGREMQLQGSSYREKLYSCQLPAAMKGRTAESVSLGFTNCDIVDNIIPVHVPRKDRQLKLGLCMVSANGHLQPKELVEWIELNKILGIQEINVCDSGVNPAARRVFEYYRRQKGYVKVRDITPAVNRSCHWCQKLSDLLCLNDCMYENMHRYKNTVVIDFDEVLIPKKIQTLPKLLAKLRKDNRHIGEPYIYVFRNAYFFKGFHSTSSKKLRTGTYITRVEASDYSYSPKTIVNPRKCLIMRTHNCDTLLPGGGEAVMVSEEQGLSHHYKQCHLKEQKCKQLMRRPVKDRTALKYQTALKQAVKKALHNFNT